MLKSIFSPITGILLAAVVLIAGLAIVGGKRDVQPTAFQAVDLLVDNTAKIGFSTGNERLSILSDQGGSDNVGFYKYNVTQSGVKSNFYRRLVPRRRRLRTRHRMPRL